MPISLPPGSSSFPISPLFFSWKLLLPPCSCRWVGGRILGQVLPIATILEAIEDTVNNGSIAPIHRTSFFLRGQHLWQQGLEDFPFCIGQTAWIGHSTWSRRYLAFSRKSQKISNGFYKVFKSDEARHILEWLEFCYTPKHGSWLNMVEIELSILSPPIFMALITQRSDFPFSINSGLMRCMTKLPFSTSRCVFT